MNTTETLVNLQELSEICNLGINALRVYLNGFRFTKYEKLIGSKMFYVFNRNFVEELSDFFILKKRIDLAVNIEEYYAKKR